MVEEVAFDKWIEKEIEIMTCIHNTFKKIDKID